MEKMTRKKFISKTGVAVVASAAGCMFCINSCAAFSRVGDTHQINTEAYQISPGVLKIDLSKEPKLNEMMGAVKIIDEQLNDGLIIVRVDDHTFVVSSIYCTHRQAEVEFDHQNNIFECTSFGKSRFELDGQNISGRAAKPLQAYETTLEDNILTVLI